MSDRRKQLEREDAELRQKYETIKQEVQDLHDRENDLDAGQQERLDRQLVALKKVRDQRDLTRAELRDVMLDAARAGEMTIHDGIPGQSAQQQYGRHSTAVGLRSLDAMAEHMPADRQDAMDKAIRQSPTWAEDFAAHSDPAYLRAWTKLLMAGEAKGHLAMSDQERAAMSRAIESRAMAEGATTTGGYGVPVAIDPSILMTGQGSGNPVLDLARKVDVTTNVFKPVNSAGVTWSFDSEAAEVSDDSPVLDQPSVTVFTARGFVPYSLEVEQDYANFQAEMARLLAEGYRELLAEKFARGSGNGEPRGLLTALDANTNSEVTVTTDGAFGVEDLYKVWKAVPERFRDGASWITSVDVNNRIRQFATATPAFHASTVTLPAGAADVLFGKPVYSSSYWPDFTGTTGAAQILTVGDIPATYTVARRAGMSIELVPHLLHTNANRPSGQRGYFAWSRIGGNSVVDVASRLLNNT